MNALFDEQNNIVVEYIGDAVLPVSNFDGLRVHHESLELQKVEELISGFGGSVSGHTVTPNYGEILDHNQFEIEKEEKNV